MTRIMYNILVNSKKDGSNPTVAASPASSQEYYFHFRGLPLHKRYIMRCEQFAMEGTGVNSTFGDNGAAGKAPIGVVEVEGFDTTTHWQNDADRLKASSVLTRFSTLLGNGDPDGDCVSPPETPGVIISGPPQNGAYRISIRSVKGDDLMVRRNNVGNVTDLPDWILILSFEGIDDDISDATYYNQ